MKSETREEYEKIVNRVVDYINTHLYDNPDLKKLSEIAGLSEFHLHRVFKFIIGENIGEFILRLRLEDVAQSLKMTSSTLEDIAHQKGYTSKNALSRAFKNHFGISPSIYKAQPQDQSFFARGAERKIEELHPDFRIIEQKNLVYTRIIDWYGSPKSYAKAWKELGKYARENNLINSDTEYIGLSFDDPTITNPENCRFYACFTTSDEVKPSGQFGKQVIEGGLYAVFLLRGSYRGLLDIYFNIYMNWLPSSSYTLRQMYAFEKYLNSPTQVRETELLTEIYVPVKRK